MRPSFLDSMSYAMSQVYASVTDKIIVNIAKHFPFYDPDAKTPGVFEYQSKMLAQMGQVRKETVDIIMQSLDGADDTLRQSLEAAIMDALKDEEPKLREAARKGLLGTAEPPEVTPSQMNAFQSYYKQSADKLNLVNTVMLESTESAYRQTVSNVVSLVQKINNTQTILNASTGEVVTGVSAWNSAMHSAVRMMAENGLTGFIDHAGRRWSPEAYVAMDIKTTMFNTAREAIWENADSFGSDLYQVSSHNGARPLCYPWQGKVISRTDRVREVQDLDGNKIHVYAQSETTYGQAAGLFGINCKHYPMTFIPGISTLRGQPQDPEENEKAYAESQEQRALERKLRKEKLDLAVLKAEGADEDEIKAQRDRVRKASVDIDDFCDKTGRARRRNREYTPVNASFPDKATYDPSDFSTAQRDRINQFYSDKAKPIAEKTSESPKIAYGELFDKDAPKITEKVGERVTKLYRIDNDLGFVGDVRISRNLPQDMDVFDLHYEHKELVPAAAQFIEAGNKIDSNGRSIIEVHSENASATSLAEEFAGRYEIRKRHAGEKLGTSNTFYTVAGSLEGTLLHEYGHYIAYKYNAFGNANNEESKEYRKWLIDFFYSHQTELLNISQYAASHPDEMFAEAFVQSFDTEHTDTEAYKLSKEIMDGFHKYIGFDPGR